MEEKMNFEDTMKELENILQKLESGELNLDESIKTFEKGIELSKKASKYLEDAEKRITVLVNDNEEKIKEEKFDN